MLYGSEIWWPGPDKPAAKHVEGERPRVTHGLSYQLNKLRIALSSAMRACIPAWKTTPIPAMQREASIPPIEIILNNNRRRHALRLGTLPTGHPLVSRILNHKPLRDRGNGTAPTTLTEVTSLASGFPRPVLYAPTYADTPLALKPKDDAAKDVMEWLNSVEPNRTVVYTDGSKTLLDDKSRIGTGYGYVLYRNNKIVHAGCRPLDKAEVFDAEAEGAAHGLLRATQLFPQDPITVCLGNAAVLHGLQGKPPDSSQHAFLQFYKAANKHNHDVSTKWSPGHMNIPGNEMADTLAKKGAHAPIPKREPTRSYVKRILRRDTRRDLSAWWIRERPNSYKHLGLMASLKPTDVLMALGRQDLHLILAARTGHGDFADYHTRFNHPDANQNCSCGKRKTPVHPLFCRKAKRAYHPGR
ncbi:hypothetical protein FNYG_15652 [Fusarium nygamai]|uniref:RNase H type-1 domain-containing protein n=1 Tax=Gibberella nygamai TaxID=42673 RepID=A0A2K0U8B2_GIBNY|nr:hypothetical protein FNYG_15652 [Fusarium nygamai]